MALIPRQADEDVRSWLLQHWAAGGTPRQRLVATIIIERERGTVIDTIAGRMGVHRETVRRWWKRYCRSGLSALIERQATRRSARVFGVRVRAAICRVADTVPSELGEPYAQWSLSRLRAYLVQVGVVEHISVERLRQILSETNGRALSWRAPPPSTIRLDERERQRLQRLLTRGTMGPRAAIVLAAADEHPIKAIAMDLAMSESTVRRWIGRYRLGGVAALIAARHCGEPLVFTSAVRERIVAVAGRAPRDLGLMDDRWSLSSLRRYLIRRRIVARISKEWLRQIVRLHEPNATPPVTTGCAPTLEPHTQEALPVCECVAPTPLARRV